MCRVKEPPRTAVGTMRDRVRVQAPVLRREGAVEEQVLEADVVVEVVEMAQMPHAGRRVRAHGRCVACRQVDGLGVAERRRSR